MKYKTSVALLLVTAGSLSACSPRHDEWVPIGYFSVFDQISMKHVTRVFSNLAIEWKPGKEGFRGYSVEIRFTDRGRAMAALLGDEQAGNISFLNGVDSPNSKPSVEFVGRTAAEFLKDRRFAEGTLGWHVVRHPDFTDALKVYPCVNYFAIRTRSHLDPENRRRQSIEGWFDLVEDLERRVAGQGIQFTACNDGEVIEVRAGGEWMQGAEHSKEILRRWAHGRPK